MMRLETILAAALIGVAATASADSQLIRKAGEWEVRISNGLIPPSTERVCYGADKPVTEIPTFRMQDCTRNDIGGTGAAATVNAECTLPNHKKITVHATITTTPTSYHLESRMHVDDVPAGVPPDVTMVIDAKHLGPCQEGEMPVP